MQPNSRAEAGTVRGDLAACLSLLRHGSKSFYTASLFLPGGCRAHAVALYAFCRQADDAVDIASPDAPDPLAGLHRRLQAAAAGRPGPCAADRALARTMAATGMPLALPQALLEGFAWDLAGRCYQDIEDLEAYAARVAGSVGAMMTVIMGVRAPAALARACDLGIAMQLSNIVRDVREDAENGRVYLPRRWLREVGLGTEELLANPVYDPRLAIVLRRLVTHASRLYRRADAGIAMLPRRCRPAILLASRLYEGIGLRAVDGRRDPMAARTVVPGREKLKMIARACRDSFNLDRGKSEMPLPAAAFLVTAASLPERAASKDAGGGIAWLIDLFDRLERMDRGMVRG